MHQACSTAADHACQRHQWVCPGPYSITMQAEQVFQIANDVNILLLYQSWFSITQRLGVEVSWQSSVDI